MIVVIIAKHDSYYQGILYHRVVEGCFEFKPFYDVKDIGIPFHFEAIPLPQLPFLATSTSGIQTCHNTSTIDCIILWFTVDILW